MILIGQELLWTTKKNEKNWKAMHSINGLFFQIKNFKFNCSQSGGAIGEENP